MDTNQTPSAGNVPPAAARAVTVHPAGVTAAQVDGAGCHAGKEQLQAAARAAGKSEALDQYAQDYPKGPHDQPQ